MHLICLPVSLEASKTGTFFYKPPLICFSSSLDSLVSLFIHFLFLDLPSSSSLFLSHSPSFCLHLSFIFRNTVQLSCNEIHYLSGLDVPLLIHCPSSSRCHIRSLETQTSLDPLHVVARVVQFLPEKHTPSEEIQALFPLTLSQLQ